MNLFREKFDLIIVSCLFVIVMAVFVASGYRTDVKEFGILIIGYLGAVLGVRRATTPPAAMQVENLETAKTEHGNIIVGREENKEGTE